jgi:hypothetical protein
MYNFLASEMDHVPEPVFEGRGRTPVLVATCQQALTPVASPRVVHISPSGMCGGCIQLSYLALHCFAVGVREAFAVCDAPRAVVYTCRRLPVDHSVISSLIR